MKIITRSLLAATAALLSLASCSAAPLGGPSATKREDLMDEISRFAPENSSVGGQHGQDKETDADNTMTRNLRYNKGRGQGDNNKDNEKCKVSKQDGTIKGDCTLLDILTARKKEFSIFLELAEAGLLLDNLDRLNKNGQPITVFVPTNEAFEEVGDFFTKFADTDIWGRKYASAIVSYYATAGEIRSEDFVDGQTVLSDDVDSAVASPVTIDLDSTPPQLEGPFVPSPTNIIEVDNVGTNGVFHVVDRAFPLFFMTVNILQAATFRPEFTSNFVELIRLAGLTELLEGPGPLQIYVIPNPVFASVPGLFDSLSAMPPDQLQALMLNHIVDERVFCGEDDQPAGAQTLQSLAGNELVFVDAGEESRTINGIKILDDSSVGNGKIDFIAGVLFP